MPIKHLLSQSQRSIQSILDNLDIFIQSTISLLQGSLCVKSGERGIKHCWACMKVTFMLRTSRIDASGFVKSHSKHCSLGLLNFVSWFGLVRFWGVLTGFEVLSL